MNARTQKLSFSYRKPLLARIHEHRVSFTVTRLAWDLFIDLFIVTQLGALHDDSVVYSTPHLVSNSSNNAFGTTSVDVTDSILAVDTIATTKNVDATDLVTTDSSGITVDAVAATFQLNPDSTLDANIESVLMDSHNKAPHEYLSSLCLEIETDARPPFWTH